MSISEPIGIGSHWNREGADAQAPAEVAVVMRTLIRPSLIGSLQSVYDQDFKSPIHVVIGVDAPVGEEAILQTAIDRRPEHVSVTCLRLPYSTGHRRGGVHMASDGGALMSILVFMANARHVAYLDDDNSWRPNHLGVLMEAVQGVEWAHSLRMLVDEVTGREVTVDRWDSVGTDKGRFAHHGGFVDPNTLLVDKVALTRATSFWSEGWRGGDGWGADKNYFGAIARRPGRLAPVVTVDYRIRRRNALWQFIREEAAGRASEPSS